MDCPFTLTRVLLASWSGTAPRGAADWVALVAVVIAQPGSADAGIRPAWIEFLARGWTGAAA